MDIGNTNNQNNTPPSTPPITPVTPQSAPTPPVSPAPTPPPITPPTPPTTPAPPVTPPPAAPTPATPEPTLPQGSTPLANASVTSSNDKNDFPFKPIEPEDTAKKDTQIGVQLDKKSDEEHGANDKNLSDDKIEVIDNSASSPTQEPTPTSEPEPKFDHIAAAPIKQQSSTKPIITVMSFVLAFIALGFAGGFFGFRYYPKLAKLFTATADTDSSSSTSSSDTASPQSTSTTAGDITVWPIYSNSQYLYSIKYPDNWYSQGTNDSKAKTVTFSSINPTDTTATGYNVEINTQSLNNQDLKTWVTASNTVGAVQGSAPTALTVGGQEAYQQTTTDTTKTLNTYIKRGTDVIIISYSGSQAKFDDGKALYDKMISSIKLN